MREQISRGLGIPRELYVSQELFDLEMESVFARSWLLAGHVSQLDAPGRYVTVECGDESVIVARTAAGGLAAYANVCRHRGARLVDPGCGTARRIVCPYHQWAYEMDGTLRGAPKMPAGFDPTAHPLARVAVEVWQGLVFVNLAGTESLADLLGPGEAVVSPFDLAGARVAHTITYEVAANWKIVWENAQECYHCNVNHPELMRTFDLSVTEVEGAYRSEDRRVQSTPLPLKREAVSLTVDGRPACALPLGHGTNTAALHLKPTFALVSCPDYAVVLRERPLAIDRTEVTMMWLVRRDAVEGRDYDLENLIKVWDQTNRQDWELCERTQVGVRSRFFEPGPLSGDEPSVAGFHHAYAEMLEGAGR